jgi:hypothetical protein
MFNKLVTRNVSLNDNSQQEVPKGQKLILVFGVIAVPENTPLGNNQVVGVSSNLVLDLDDLQPLPKNLAAWDAQETCKEVFNIGGTREVNEMADAERGLKLISSNQRDDPELQTIAKKLKRMLNDLPTFDVLRQVIKAIISQAEQHKKKK